MENYVLGEDEVVLYQGNVLFSKNKQKTQFIFTNLNFVFIHTTEGCDSSEVVTTDKYPIDDVKMYEGAPQVIPQKTTLTVYFKSGEVEFSFENRAELNKALKKIKERLTGKKAGERAAEKVNGVINCLNKALGVNLVESAGCLIQECLKSSAQKAGESIGNSVNNLIDSLANKKMTENPERLDKKQLEK